MLHGQTMFSEQIAPLVRLRNEVWTLWYREHVLSGRGLACRPLSPRRAHVKMTSPALCYSSTRCAVCTISHTAQSKMCADLKSERRGTENISQCSQSDRSCTENLFGEHFSGYVYREHIHVHCMNGPSVYKKLKGKSDVHHVDHASS